MPTTRTTKKPGVNTGVKSASTKTSKPSARMSLTETMRALEKAGTAQNRKTYTRHGAEEPMFGVSFATLKTLVKKIGVDHELAHELWKTKNHDARILALKIADPARMSPSDLDLWTRANATSVRMCGGYAAMLAAEGPHGVGRARAWLASSDAGLRAAGWTLTAYLASLDETLPDEWFLERIATIENSIHQVSNAERESMNSAMITIGGRNAALRKAATSAAKRVGKVEVDHGDTACKTPEAGPYIEKMWAHATANKFASPAAQERARESMRTRC